MLNHFKKCEIISARTPEVLAEKLRILSMSFQIVNIWADGKSHYALINGNKRLTERDKNALSRLEESQDS